MVKLLSNYKVFLQKKYKKSLRFRCEKRSSKSLKGLSENRESKKGPLNVNRFSHIFLRYLIIRGFFSNEFRISV